MRLIDLENPAHVYCGEHGEYENWNIDSDVPTVDAVPVIRCKDCGQREYGCSTFIDHNQIYGFCAWGWKAERKEE